MHRFALLALLLVIVGSLVTGAFASLLLGSSASAQQASPQIQAMADRIMRELNENLACKTDGLAKDAEIAKLKAELSQLRASPQPPKPPETPEKP